jgi:pantoate--beta-alanine ligase
MGALHAGHLALVETAKAAADHVVVSIFVNPKQFSAGQDLSRYPRPLEEDIALLRTTGVTLLFTPSEAELYPEGFATYVEVAALGDVLCGAHRGGHFVGVATVVTLLCSLVRPDVACFGEKDFQQLAIITRLNRDLRLASRVLSVPTVREADGLACSSRNRLLNSKQRAIAPMLYRTLTYVRTQLYSGVAPEEALHAGMQALLDAGFTRLDYLEMRDATTLALTERCEGARLFAAAWLGTTRLIDNLSLAS